MYRIVVSSASDPGKNVLIDGHIAFVAGNKWNVYRKAGTTRIRMGGSISHAGLHTIRGQL